MSVHLVKFTCRLFFNILSLPCLRPYPVIIYVKHSSSTCRRSHSSLRWWNTGESQSSSSWAIAWIEGTLEDVAVVVCFDGTLGDPTVAFDEDALEDPAVKCGTFDEDGNELLLDCCTDKFIPDNMRKISMIKYPVKANPHVLPGIPNKDIPPEEDESWVKIESPPNDIFTFTCLLFEVNCHEISATPRS